MLAAFFRFKFERKFSCAHLRGYPVDQSMTCKSFAWSFGRLPTPSTSLLARFVEAKDAFYR